MRSLAISLLKNFSETKKHGSRYSGIFGREISRDFALAKSTAVLKKGYGEGADTPEKQFNVDFKLAQTMINT